MICKIKFSIVFLLCPIFIFSQKNELGIGLPGISINNQAYSNSITEHLYNNSEIYSPRLQTKKTSSIASPIIYYTRNISKKYFITSSISYQQEKLKYNLHSHIIVEDPEVSQNYLGKFSQVKFNLGLGHHLIQNKKFKLYSLLNLTSCYKSLLEKWVGQSPIYSHSENNLYYLGFTPAIGFDHKISHLYSISFESGLEVTFPTNSLNQNIYFWNPLNRFSLNYHF